MKKLMIIITLTLTLFIAGCSNSKDFQIQSKDLTEEESILLTLTGNRVSKYNLKNFPNDKTFELKLVYEVYKNGEKIKDEQIFGMRFGPTDEKFEDTILAINIQDNMIRCISGGAYAYLDIEEDISKLSYQFFYPNYKINLGDEIYLYHGSTGESGFVTLNSGILSKEDKDQCINGSELSVFLKLVCEE